jgi:hypothetical protein
MRELLLVVAALFALAGATLLVGGLRGLRRRRLLPGGLGATSGVALLSLGALALTLSVATQGYRAFTREDVVATVETRPAGPQSFDAVFQFPSGRSETFRLGGDELYVDAHILKWRPWANVLGLHTDYELDRVAGRYARLEDERDRARTVFSLARSKAIDLFELRRRYAWLHPLVDTEYGSATFITAGDHARFEVLVSTSGLLVRRVEAPARP